MIKWIGFTLIALCVLLAYAPSLMQLPRGDQVHYLAEVADKHSLWDLTIGCIDLNRHRLISAGDQILFRPLLYIILGAERYFFQYHFMYWQATGIILHLIVVWLLLGLFCAMGEVIPAILATAFFALLFVNMEMVVWQHISSYIFFVILLLLSLLRLHKICLSQENRHRDYWVLWSLLLAACLTYEIGNGFALLVGMVIWARGLKYRAWAMALFAIPLIYLALSLINVLVHPFVLPKADPISPHGGFLWQLPNMFYAIGAWAYIGVFPHEFEWVIRSRNMIATTELHLIKWPHLDQWPSVIGMGLILLFAWAQIKFNKGFYTYFRQVICFIAVFMIFFFAFMVAFGRGNQWPMHEVIECNTYYMYIFWFFLMLVLFAIFPAKKIPYKMGVLLGVLLISLMCFNANRLYAFNEKQGLRHNEIIVLLKTVEILIDEHGSEKDFSFYVDPEYPGNYILTDMTKKGDPPGKLYSFIEAIYPQYFTRNNPKYRFLALPRPSQGVTQ